MTSSRIRTAAALCRLLPWFLALGALKRVVPLHTLARWSWSPARRASRAPDPARIASTVLRAGALAGVPDRDCLQRSLLLYRELSRAGLGPELAVGFQRVDGALAGHAWVTIDGLVVGECDLNPARFAPILRFGARGALLREETAG